MHTLESVTLTPEAISRLRSLAERAPVAVPFHEGPPELSLISALGIAREVGTINDELAEFAFDGATGLLLGRENLRGEVVVLRGHYGVRIWSPGCENIDVRVVGFRQLLDPAHSFDAEGKVRQIVLFPRSVSRILALEQVDLTFVREWALNTIFDGFDPMRRYYETNDWELLHYDSERFAGMIEKRRLTLLGTHDLVAHVAGVEKAAWGPLVKEARGMRETLEIYFSGAANPNIASRILPYAAGVVLDDLAQPPNYAKSGRRLVLGALLDRIRQSRIAPSDQGYLLRFPQTYSSVISLAREEAGPEIPRLASSLALKLEQEILNASARF